MLKQAFRFLGIGFFLSGCLLLGLTYTGQLNSSTTNTNVTNNSVAQTVTTTSSSQSARTQDNSTSSVVTQSSQVETSSQTTQSSETVKFTIATGDDSYSIAEKLMAQGLISNTTDFINYLVENKLDTTIQNGTFAIPKNSSFEQLGKILTTYPGN